MNKLTLDVGCGTQRWRARGDINCNIEKPLMTVNSKKIPNFILCDAQYLPFKDNVFDTASCYHVIEHVKNPVLLLKELIRVSNSHIRLRCPHRYCRYHPPSHINFFTVKWFSKVLRKLNVGYYITTKMRGFPFSFLSLIQMPHEIIIEIKKYSRIEGHL